MDTTLIPATAAAFWSAVAASCAALASLVIMLIQRRSLLESVRPEIVLTGWSRAIRGEGDEAYDVIKFKEVKNVGRGAALHVLIGGREEVDGLLTAILCTRQLPILPPNETSVFNGEIIVWWKNVKFTMNGEKYLPINIRILCWDSRGMRHETKYSIFTVELRGSVSIGEGIAPGVELSSRTTVSKSVRFLKLCSKLARIAGLRWLAVKSDL